MKNHTYYKESKKISLFNNEKHLLNKGVFNNQVNMIIFLFNHIKKGVNI